MLSKFLFIFVIISHLHCENKFLLILGVSGVGKTTIIKHLKNIDKRFTYITPLTTRALRPNETDKISLSLDEIIELKKKGKLLTVNKIFGNFYATPKYLIDETLKKNNFPVLDWPLDQIDKMIKIYKKENLFVVYLLPDNTGEWKRRISSDNRDLNGERTKLGLAEINDILSGSKNDFLDILITNEKEESMKCALKIYQNYIETNHNID